MEFARLNLAQINTQSLIAYDKRKKVQIPIFSNHLEQIANLFRKEFKEQNPDVELYMSDETVFSTINNNLVWCSIEMKVERKYGKIHNIYEVASLSYGLKTTNKQRILKVGHYEKGIIDFVEYRFNDINFMAQRDGFTLLVAPTGQGKTFNATFNIVKLHNQFDNILYLNFELTKADIMTRILTHTKFNFKKTLEIEKKLIVIKNEEKSHFTKISNFIELCELFPKSLIVIDNIDNIKSGKENDWLEQSRFIQQLDAYLKLDTNDSTALVLSQLTKDRDSLYTSFGKGSDKYYDLSPELNENLVSGAKQLSNNARSVVLVLQHAYSKDWVARVLKYGSGTLSALYGKKVRELKEYEAYKKWVIKEM